MRRILRSSRAVSAGLFLACSACGNPDAKDVAVDSTAVNTPAEAGTDSVVALVADNEPGGKNLTCEKPGKGYKKTEKISDAAGSIEVKEGERYSRVDYDPKTGGGGEFYVQEANTNHPEIELSGEDRGVTVTLNASGCSYSKSPKIYVKANGADWTGLDTKVATGAPIPGVKLDSTFVARFPKAVITGAGRDTVLIEPTRFGLGTD